MMSDLPRELAEDVIIRLPMTSMRAVRSVCKEWNTLSKDSFFTKKHIAQAKAAAAEEFKVVMVMDFKVYLTNLNLHGIHKGVDPTISRQGKLISLDDSNQVDISRVYHCDGLVLCITKDLTRLVVWNPYWGQTLWVKPGRLHQSPNMYKYAIGYENSKSGRSYKILRHAESKSLVEYSIYELNSNSWRDVVDVTCDLYIHFYARGVSLKGNTYWFGVVKYQERISVEIHGFLICFDFTRERFGPRLRLPFIPYQEDTVTLSSVREEQLAVLFQRWDSLQMEIWVTVKIEPEVVLWNKVFLRVDMEPLTGFQFGVTEGSFFIDQDKKVAVVFDKDKDKDNDEVKTTPRRNTAYIIGEGGYFREVDLGETSEIHDCPLGCSYVPNSMLIKQRGKRKKNLIIY
ncbi:PREDICTED: putative F-box protein At3g17620 [Camelina sativa]|uniref:F-box protein At3g17620 n=1 Tax=Camelina sativa TaxID=90675 RepID=A0ABM1R0U8_CAMSA|nr:PREDICTED: putative F-box protein At3g17620 [Camelina sativa]